MNYSDLGAVILAAGKGKRMNSKKTNKVLATLRGKPMISYIIELLKRIGIDFVVVVVGFAKYSVMQALKKNNIVFAEQKKRLGTAHAVACALPKLSENILNVLVFQGDDSAFYKKEIIKDLINKHYSSQADLTFLTIEIDNPAGLGRIVRDEKGDVITIIEEKDATGQQKLIKEINPACYIFKTNFLRKYLKKVKKSKITGEYYLTSLINIAISNKKNIKTLKVKNLKWRGVNTSEELEEARKIFTENYN